MKRTLKKLQKEKLENKRRGSAVGRAENEEEKKKNRTVSVKVRTVLVINLDLYVFVTNKPFKYQSKFDFDRGQNINVCLFSLYCSFHVHVIFMIKLS